MADNSNRNLFTDCELQREGESPGYPGQESQSSTLKSGALDLPAAHSTLILGEYNSGQYGEVAARPRLLTPVLARSGELGVRLVGGNKVGIFVHSLEADSAAGRAGLQRGDQILEYNGTDLSSATAEQAAYELAKPVEHVSILAVFRPRIYTQVKDQPGDSYFIRAMFDRLDSAPPGLLFRKEDILWVDNTMYQGVPGQWSAWLLDTEGRPTSWGVIPSKYKVEEGQMLKRSSEFSSRRSFFKRKKVELEGRELAVYSEVETMLSQTDTERLHRQLQTSSYLRVEKRQHPGLRPVLLVGPYAQPVMDKLAADYPARFSSCQPEILTADQATVERGAADQLFIDYRRRGSQYEVITMRSVRATLQTGRHPLVEVSNQSQG